jgi:hypothetical protein
MKSLSVKLGIILIGSLIFLLSCSSSPSGGKWVKPNSGESEFEKDYNNCRSMALQQCRLDVWPGYVVAKNCVNESINDCLIFKGWEYQKP